MYALAIAPSSAPETFTPEMRRRLRAEFSGALTHLREHGCGGLKTGPWAVLVAILGPMGPGMGQHEGGWLEREESWLGQVMQGQRAGCSDRTVRRHIPTLLAGGFLVQRREPRALGGRRHDKLYYRPGPVVLAALGSFVGQRPKHLKLVPRSPDNLTHGSPDRTATEPQKPKIFELLARDISPPDVTAALAAELSATAIPAAVVEEEVFRGGDVENLAREALAAHFVRAFPGLRAPTVADPVELLQVMACLRLVHEGDRRLTLRDSMDGAWIASKDRAPSAKFIWASPDYFARHAERGRARRLAAAARAHAATTKMEVPSSRSSSATPEEIAAAMAQISAVLGP